MSRAQVIVTVTAAVPRRGNDSATGTAFLLYAAATGTTTPVVCLSAADATASTAPDPVAQYVSDTLEQGAPRVVLLRAAAVDPAAVTQPEWETALGLLTDEFGPGQVLIPGVTTVAAYTALLKHADAANRAALLDCAPVVVAATLVTTAAGLASADGSQRATIVTGAVLPAPGGTTRNVPGSVVAAGLAARGDAYAGHANNAPIFDQGHGAGTVRRAVGVPTVFTDAEVDALTDAGVSVIRTALGVTQLVGWVSLSADDRFRQLNAGRMSMALAVGINYSVHQFLGRQIDGRGHLYAELEGALRGYLQPLGVSDALYSDANTDPFDVQVAAVNTPTTAAAGELHAAVEVQLTQYTEKVVIDVVTAIGAN